MTTTNNGVNVTLSGQTGTGNFVGSTSPTLITPTIGVATATSVNGSGTAGCPVQGTTAGGNATAGYVGEYIVSNIVSGSAVSLTTATNAQITSISLTAGDWDVEAQIVFSTAATTSVTNLSGGMSLSSSSFAAGSDTLGVFINYYSVFVPGTDTFAFGCPRGRQSLSGTTTVYLLALATFTASTLSAYGYISARRVR